MKEYNWREERKKYRPDFRNDQDAKEEPPQTPPPQTPPPSSPANRIWMIVAAAAVVIVVIFGIFLIVDGSRNSGSAKDGKTPPPVQNVDSANALAQVAEAHKRSVGLVGLCVEYQDGKKVFESMGTAWAFAPDKFATNAHVALGLRDAARKYLASSRNSIRSFEVQIVINGTSRLIRPVIYVQIHRDYGLYESKQSQREPDVAVLITSGKHDSCFKIAAKPVLHGLKSGDPVAFLGFPMKYLPQENIHVDNPIASMQTGNIVAVSDFDLKDAGAERNVWIRHNLPTAGGASGSPIFNVNGEVVALNCATSATGQVVENGKVAPAPSASMINFGVRADLLEGVGDPVPVKDFIR